MYTTREEYMEEREMRDGEYFDVAQICENGHIINIYAQSRPKRNKKYCEKCGAITFKRCSNCKTLIRGYLHTPNVHYIAKIELPKFCLKCGVPYPWTKLNIKALEELIEATDGLKREERDFLKNGVKDLIEDTPRAKAFASRFRELLSKKKGSMLEEIKKIAIEISSKAIAEIIRGN